MSGSADRPVASVRRRRRFSLIWLVPITAAGIGLYLAVKTLLDQGPLITITFLTANGITAGQTEVKHKAVSLGTVESVRLSKDLKQVIVQVRMKREGDQLLTTHAHFWVVRPRLTAGNISGLETLVSGGYIEVDPGDPGGEPADRFTGLEDPPAVRSDEPGKSYMLRAARLGSIGSGAPVFYRDVVVGEVLSYDIGDGLGPVKINVFVRSPYDRFVRPSTHFWNTSGISVSFGPQGLHVELQSLQALLSGGIAFSTPPEVAAQKPSADGSSFPLYNSKSDADAAGYITNIPFVTYFKSSVGGLARGSPVEVFGIQIGTVTDVHLLLESGGQNIQARVAFDLQPERVFTEQELSQQKDPELITRTLVSQGMRAVLESTSLITGGKAISLEYVPGAPPAVVSREGDALVMPSQAGGLDNITSSLSSIATKLNAIPFDQIGASLNHTLASLDRATSGPDLKAAVHNLSQTLADVRGLVRRTDAGLQPVLQRLPQMSRDLQTAIVRFSTMLGQDGYGGNSDFQRNVARLLDQLEDAARSIRMLADFLDRHPEALIRGRTAEATGR